MKKIITLLLCLSIAVSAAACSSASGETSTETQTSTISETSEVSSAASASSQTSEASTAESSEENTWASSTVKGASETKGNIAITTNDLVGAVGFDLAEIANGSSADAVLSALGITKDDLNAASTDSTWLIDSVSVTLDGYKFYPRVDFWNNEVFVVYLCAAEGTDTAAAHEHFSSEFEDLYGLSEKSGEALIWTKAETRLWENQSVAFGSTSDCYAIEIQRVAA